MTVTRRGFLGAGMSAALYSRVLGANDRVQVAFIGYGLIGRQHVHDFKQQPDADLMAVCEVHEGRLRQGLADCGPRAQGYGDFRKLLENRDVQAVVVSTPDHWHALITMMACAAGKDVYVEKPMTLFVREGRWMVDVARRCSRVVQVGTQQRSGTHYQRALQLIRGGHIGKIVSVRMGAFRNVMPGFGSPPDSNPPPELDYDMWLGPAPQRRYNRNRSLYHFRWFWDYSGGQITNLGAHEVDVIHWVMDTEAPAAVSSSGGRLALQDNGETPDTQDALFDYPGFTAVWSHREAAFGQGIGEGLHFCGTKGSMTLARSGFTVFPDMKNAPENEIPQFRGHPVGGPVRDSHARPEPWTQALNESASNDLLSTHARNFLDCVKSRQRPTADVETGHRTATACHLANISLRVGRKLGWDGEKEEIIDDTPASTQLVRAYRPPWDKELEAIIKA